MSDKNMIIRIAAPLLILVLLVAAIGTSEGVSGVLPVYGTAAEVQGTEDADDGTAVTGDASLDADTVTEEAAFTASEADENAAAEASEVSDGEGYVTQINSFEISLVSGATLNSAGDYVWNASGNTAGHKFKFSVNYSTSGVSTVAAETFSFRIPASILNNKSGENADTISMSYPQRETLDDLTDAQKESAAGFAWYLDGDDIIVYNFKEISAAQTGYFEISYLTDEQTCEYYDYGAQNDASDPFYAALSVSGLEASSGEICVYIDTSVSITGNYKYYPTKYTAWNSSWGTQPSGSAAAYYLVWEIRSVISSGTQYYDFILEDSNITYTAVYEDGSTRSGDLSDGQITIAACKMQGGSYTLASEDAYDGISVTVQGLSSDGNRYDYVVVALSEEVFSEAVSFTVTNTAVSYVDPADGVDETTSAVSSRSYSWTQPTWTTPTGHFNIYKYGNENYSSYFGDYMSYELSTLQEEDAVTEEAAIENIRYLIKMNGYAYPWTLRDDWASADGYAVTDSSGTLIPNYNAYGFSDVTYTITDDTIYPLYADGTDRSGTDLANCTGEEDLDEYGQIEAYAGTQPLESEDYDFSGITYSVTFTDAQRDDNGDPVINESTSEYITETRAADETDIITLYVKTGDSWLKAGTYNLGTDVWTADAQGGSYVEEFTDTAVAFSSGVDGYQMVFSNNYYRTSVSVYAYVTLYATENVQEWVGTEKEGTAEDVVLMRNAVVLNVYYTDEYDSAGEGADPIVSIAKVIGDRLRRAQLNSFITKSAALTANNTVDQTYTLTWRVTAYETVKTDDDETAYLQQESGTFYDLLPYGSSYEADSVLIRTEDGYLDSSDYEITLTGNYNGSGRTMLMIQIEDAADYYMVYFNTIYSWETLIDVGFEILNPVAYETGNEEIAGGYPDDGGDLTEEDDNRSLMTDLDPDTDAERFLYSSAKISVDIETAAATGLTKKVKSDSDSGYSYDTTVSTSETYSYRLRYANTQVTRSSNMILYDSLEDYGTSEWHGLLAGIDVSQLQEMGISPKVYILTGENIDLSGYTEDFLPDLSAWTLVDESDYQNAEILCDASAVAIDMSTGTDGADFILEEGKSVAVILYMTAPSSDTSEGTDDYPETYNNVFMSMTSISETDVETDYYIHHDYTTVRYAVTGNVYLKKVSSADEDEVIAGITFLLSGTSDYGTKVSVTKTTGKSGLIKWADIEKGTYTLQEYGDYDDWLADHEERIVCVDGAGNVTIDGEKNSSEIYYIAENDPRVHADIVFSKRDAFTKEALGSGFTFRLYGTSDYGNTVNVYADSASSGKITFSNIEAGTYTLVEISADDDHINEELEYTVKVDSDGNVSITLDGQTLDATASGTTILYNIPYQSFTILKRSSYDNTAVTGVTFTLKGTSDLGNDYESEQTTGTDGSATFTGLEPGIYTLEETDTSDAVPSVTADTSVRIVVISSDGTITVDQETLETGESYPIINTQTAEGMVSVIKKWITENVSSLYNDDGTPDFPTLYLSTEDPAQTSAEGD